MRASRRYALAPEVNESTAPHTATTLLRLLEQVRAIASECGRSDLAHRLDRSAARLGRPAVRVMVVGEFKTGKSSLVNALVGADVCPVDDDLATTVPTVVHHANTLTAAALVPGEDPEAPPHRVGLDVAALAEVVTESGPQSAGAPVAVEVGVPSPFLQEGLVLCDTPGVGGLGSPHMATTVGALPLAEAVLFVTDGAQELTAPELAFLETARKLCPDVHVVLTKVDFHRDWHRIVELDEAHLRRIGLADPKVVAVSAPLLAWGVRQGDAAAVAESGYPELERLLLGGVVAASRRLRMRAGLSDLLDVGGQLASRLSSERTALEDPDRGARLVTSLKDAQERAAALRVSAARWQQTLNDGVTDLASQVDFDLRARMRNLGREADEVIDGCDPADTWSEVEAWLRHHATASVTDNYTVLRHFAGDLAERVAGHFADDEGRVVSSLRIQAPAAGLAAIEVPAPNVTESFKLGSAAIHGARSAYGGVLMTGMVGMAVLGVPLLNPVTIVVGLLLGHKAVRDEKRRQLGVRRQQAKVAARRFLDDVSFHSAADSRNVIRHMHRELRDTFATRAEEIQRSATDALEAAQAAVAADEKDRPAALARATATLARVSDVMDQARSLATSTGLAEVRR